MMPIYIIGAGGAAKEIYLLINEYNQFKPTFDFKGFVDLSNEKYLQIGKTKHIVINEVDFLNIEEEVAVVFGLTNLSRLKKLIKTYNKNKNIIFPNIIHPNVKLDSSVSLGVGNIITSQCVFTVNIVLGNFNYINRGVHIGHDCTIDSYNVINPCSVISGGVKIESENLVGTNATILQYLKIGTNNQIGAGAVVTKDVQNNSCMIGIPAKNTKLCKKP